MGFDGVAFNNLIRDDWMSISINTSRAWAISRRLRSLFCLLVFCIVGSFLADNAHAQVKLPEGWQQLSASEFVEASSPLFSNGSKATVSQQREVVEHAFSSFLTQSSFVSDGDWDTVQSMLELFGKRRDLMVYGNARQRDDAKSKWRQQREQLVALLESRLDQNPKLISEVNFDPLKASTSALGKALSKEQIAEQYAAWMESNDWKSLSLNDHFHLVDSLNVAQVDKFKFSVRWTGFLRAPASESFVLEQFRFYEADGVMRIKLDGKQILDTSGGIGDPSLYRSQPVAMKAGVRVPIEVEYIFDRKTMTSPDSIRKRKRFPVAILQWESKSIKQQVIPGSAYSAPKNFKSKGKGAKSRGRGNVVEGLQGEYFKDLDFSELARTRLDPGVDMVWETAPVCSLHEDCLLYTSPSPRDQRGSRMPSSA